MKKAILITLMICSALANAKHLKMKLQKALDEHYIKASANSLGGYQGFCIQMNLINMSSDSLFILIEAGRRLNSLEEKDQDILITRQEIIVLKKKEQKWVPVYGYCCQASNHCPKKNAKYGLNNLGDSSLVTLARFLNSNQFDNNVTQQAIWALSDQQPSAQVYSKVDTLVKKLRNLVCTLKGEELPWYSLETKTLVYQSGVMQNFATELSGQFNYIIPKDSYTTLHVFDKKGREVCKIIRQWSLKSNTIYDLKLPVKGMAKGKYTIELKTENGEQVVQKSFEI
ncbi:MAG: hypothetical protein IPM51_02815 [Sphingobacteriaceae bacterium]|nr:hypothetical protein [Sphingobacteriaceae bacterium]